MNVSMLRRLSECADRISESRRHRATTLAVSAGLDCHRNVWHNAMLDYADGRPWARIDYSKLRAAVRVDSMPSPHAIVDRWYRRALAAARADA